MKQTKTRQKKTAWVLLIAMLMTLLPTTMLGVSAANYSGGDGTEANPYLLCTNEDLLAFHSVSRLLFQAYQHD